MGGDSHKTIGSLVKAIFFIKVIIIVIGANKKVLTIFSIIDLINVKMA